MTGTTGGALLCVGLGMTLGAHLTPRAKEAMREADVVFGLAGDALTQAWLQRQHADVRDLSQHYAEGRSRHLSYAAMQDAILAEVRAGRRVCVAVYGHPGVFARVPHVVIEAARREGFPARMEAGVSAADCLFADLGIDPGRSGCQHYEATQFLLGDPPVDPAAVLILWQVGIVGDRSLGRLSTGPEHRRLLLRQLATHYPPDHGVILYEAASHALEQARIDHLRLGDLPEARVSQKSTLVIPPAITARPRREDIAAALDALDALDPDEPNCRDQG